MIIRAELKCKQTGCEADPCAVDKVIELPSPRFQQFSRALLADYDFIAENKDAIQRDEDARHCLLILDAEGTDGFLVDPQGYNYARYSAFVPNARSLLTPDMGIDRSYLSPAEPWRDESRDEMLRMTLRVDGKPDYTLVLPADEEYLDAVKTYLDIDAFADAMLCDIRFKVPYIGELIRDTDCPAVEDYNDFAEALEDIWQQDGMLLTYTSNPDIDKSRTVQNYHLIAPRWSYGQEIRHRISMAGCRVRRDSVKFVETLITTNPEFAKAHESEMPEYFERAHGFLKERVGEENIISAVVHMDEKTPHMHLCFVPLTKDKRLSAKEILGNKKNIIRWQDDFYACMAERWPELERGVPAVETKRRHLTPQWYKKVTAMDAKLEKLEAAVNGINVLNAGKKREEAIETFRQLLPEVESFQAEIQRMQAAVSQSLSMQRCSVEENEALKDELTAERRKSAEQRAKLTVLEERYKRAEKLLSKLPRDVILQYSKYEGRNEW